MDMLPPQSPAFEQPELIASLSCLEDPALDALSFGVIAIDRDGTAVCYNATEARLAGLTPTRVLGLHFFDVVGQCMNNFLVAQRLEDALLHGQALDETLDYVLTLRMKPTPVKLRLLADPAQPLRYVCIQR